MTAQTDPTDSLMPDHVRAERRDQAHQAITQALRHTWPEWRTRLRTPDFELLAGIAMDALGELAAEILVDGTLFKSMTARDDRIVIEYEPARDMLLAMCAAMRTMLDHHGAENYVEAEAATRPAVTVDVADGQSGEAYTFTVQRRQRPTPHEFRRRAEQERDDARRQLAAVLAECDTIDAELHGQHNEDDNGTRGAIRRIRAAAGAEAAR